MFAQPRECPEYINTLLELRDDPAAYEMELYHVVEAASSEVCSLSRELWNQRNWLSGLLFDYYMDIFDDYQGETGMFPEIRMETMLMQGDIEGVGERFREMFLEMVFRGLPSEPDWGRVQEALESCFARKVLERTAEKLFNGKLRPYKCRQPQGMFDLFLTYYSIGSDLYLYEDMPIEEPHPVRNGRRQAYHPPRSLQRCSPLAVAAKYVQLIGANEQQWSIGDWHWSLGYDYTTSWAHFLLTVAREIRIQVPTVAVSEELQAALDKDAQRIAAVVRHIPIRTARDDMASVILSFLF
jgi:hypothetical protein